MNRPKIHFNYLEFFQSIAFNAENSIYTTKYKVKYDLIIPDLLLVWGFDASSLFLFSAFVVIEHMKGRVSTNDIIDFIDMCVEDLEHFNVDINFLVDNKYIIKKLISYIDSGDQSDSYFVLHPRVKNCIYHNELWFKNDINKMMDVFAFTNTVYELSEYLLAGIISYDYYIDFIEELELSNLAYIPINELKDSDLRTIDRVILYYMLYIQLHQHTGCSLYRGIAPILKCGYNTNSEIESYKDYSSLLITNLFVYNRYSDVNEDYYLELSPDSILMFFTFTNTSFRANIVNDQICDYKLQEYDFSEN